MAQIFPHLIRSRFPWLGLLPGLLFWLALPLPGYGQSQELYLDRGAVGLSQSLKRLPLISRALFIMAHPDDEPAGLVTYVSRGLGARTAILSLTRGEGGQNLVGPDLFEALGLVRTGEMLAANEFYGASQYFSRAFDFGFSRSAPETLDKWGAPAHAGGPGPRHSFLSAAGRRFGLRWNARRRAWPSPGLRAAGPGGL